jgi:hypothetical protein
MLDFWTSDTIQHHTTAPVEPYHQLMHCQSSLPIRITTYWQINLVLFLCGLKLKKQPFGLGFIAQSQQKKQPI